MTLLAVRTMYDRLRDEQPALCETQTIAEVAWRTAIRPGEVGAAIMRGVAPTYRDTGYGRQARLEAVLELARFQLKLAAQHFPCETFRQETLKVIERIDVVGNSARPNDEGRR